ncbi:MAG: hypothetical protein HQL32_04505 [Planctomycetes bacterium]|nr:hypothetical protein [Planctomycetota bacterium]
MSVVSVRMGKSLYQSVKEFSKSEGLSLSQTINSLIQESLLRKEYSAMWNNPRKYSEEEIDDVIEQISDHSNS